MNPSDNSLSKTLLYASLRGFMLVLLLAGIGVSLNFLPNGDWHARGPIAFDGSTMGTTYNVKIAFLPQNVTLDEVRREAAAVLAAVNARMSTYDPKSELSRWNASSSTDWFDVSPETAEVVNAALHIGHYSNGALDVTVGPLVNLWHFGPDKRSLEQIPSQAEIDAARKRTGLECVEVRMSPPALRKSRPDVYVDLSAIAKGYGVDQVAESFDKLGIEDYMIEVGGEVRTRGRTAEVAPWRIAVESPTGEGLQRIVSLSGAAMATSGDYRNYFESDGVRFSHIIDPRTARPIDHRLVSVSVIDPLCAAADGWATALMVLGPDEARRTAARHSLAVLLIVKTDRGFEEWTTPQFRRYADL